MIKAVTESSSFQELKGNFAEVILNPRLHKIPASYRITFLTQSLIILVSVVFAVVYTQVASQEICQAKALGDTGGSTCSELVARKELFARGDLNITSDVGQSFTIDFSMRMEAEGGAVADLSSFLVPEELSNGIAEELASSFDEGEIAFNQTSDVLDFYQRLGNLVKVFPIGFGTDVPDILVQGGGVLGLQDDIINNGTFVSPDSSVFTLVVLWKNADETIDCALENSFDPSGDAKTRNIITCESKPDDNHSSQVLFQWVSEAFGPKDFDQLVLDFYAFITNIQRQTSGPLDRQSQQLLKSFFSVNFFECCAPSSLDTLEYFGIFSGIGFVLEGVFGFVVAYAYYGGGVKRKDVIAMKKTQAAGYTGGLGDEIKKRKKAEYDEANFTHEKLLRVIFNPRCRYIPFPNVVSFVSLIVLLAISAIGASFYQQAEIQIVCQPTARTEIGTQVCSSIVLDNHVYKTVQSQNGILLPVGISATLNVEAQRLNSFDVAEIFKSDDALLPLVESACVDTGLENCVRNLETQLETIGDITFDEKFDGETEINEVDLVVENVTGIGNVQVLLKLEIIATIPAVNETAGRSLEVIYEYQESSATDTFIDYGATYSSSFDKGPEQIISFSEDGGNLVVDILKTAGTLTGAEELVVQNLDDSFVQCCKPQSLLYSDYMGLIIGFVAMGESLLTMIVGVIVYLVLGKACKITYS